MIFDVCEFWKIVDSLKETGMLLLVFLLPGRKLVELGGSHAKDLVEFCVSEVLLFLRRVDAFRNACRQVGM